MHVVRQRVKAESILHEFQHEKCSDMFRAKEEPIFLNSQCSKCCPLLYTSRAKLHKGQFSTYVLYGPTTSLTLLRFWMGLHRTSSREPVGIPWSVSRDPTLFHSVPRGTEVIPIVPAVSRGKTDGIPWDIRACRGVPWKVKRKLPRGPTGISVGHVMGSRGFLRHVPCHANPGVPQSRHR